MVGLARHQTFVAGQNSRVYCALLACNAFATLFCASAFGQGKAVEPTVGRGLTYLSREVPKWSVENKCYSCHNNGDGARALYTAKRVGIAVTPEAIEDTTRWLSNPERWKDNGGERAFNDKKLATIQFAFALLGASEAREVESKLPLLRAAELVADLQAPDGSWKTIAEGSVGSPVTYGNTLGTAIALKVLASSDPQLFKSNIEKANGWLRDKEPKNVLDAAGILVGLSSARDSQAITRQRQILNLIQKAQGKSGGWGPYANSTPEPFDTAIVLFALAPIDNHANHATMIRRGREYLVESQLDDGSWSETTRPANAESYAHRISTTGWATLALLSTGNGD